jgi:hypothetical protein
MISSGAKIFEVEIFPGVRGIGGSFPGGHLKHFSGILSVGGIQVRRGGNLAV